MREFGSRPNRSNDRNRDRNDRNNDRNRNRPGGGGARPNNGERSSGPRNSSSRRRNPSSQGQDARQRYDRPRPSRPREQDPAEKAFFASTAIDPSPRIRLEDGSSEYTVRAMDMITPIGMGQRGLIVAPPGSGKTTILKHICQSVAKSQPDIKLYCLLIDERPEEVTDFKRSIAAEVRSSSSDESYENHIAMANELMSQAYREAGAGQNVMIVLDSLTRLSRVHNAEGRSSGRTMTGGVDARALEIPRRIFGSARKIENGGSLTILATILVETGSAMDDMIFEEFKGTGNMEIVLSREISNRRIFPAIDILKSGTRKEEKLLEPDEYEKVKKIRSALADLGKVEAAETLVKAFEKYPKNEDWLKNL